MWCGAAGGGVFGWCGGTGGVVFEETGFCEPSCTVVRSSNIANSSEYDSTGASVKGVGTLITLMIAF